MKARVAQIFGEAPIGFIGAVIAIAVVFRLGVGVMKPAAAAEPEVQAPVALHTPPEPAKPTPIVTDAPPTIEPAAAATTAAATTATTTAKKRNKAPRSFGKR